MFDSHKAMHSNRTRMVVTFKEPCRIQRRVMDYIYIEKRNGIDFRGTRHSLLGMFLVALTPINVSDAGHVCVCVLRWIVRWIKRSDLNVNFRSIAFSIEFSTKIKSVFVHL